MATFAGSCQNRDGDGERVAPGRKYAGALGASARSPSGSTSARSEVISGGVAQTGTAPAYRAGDRKVPRVRIPPPPLPSFAGGRGSESRSLWLRRQERNPLPSGPTGLPQNRAYLAVVEPR